MNSQVEEMKLQRKQTVEEMRRQAYQMGEQASASHSAAHAAGESAKATLGQIRMLKDKERARVSVEISPFTNVEFRSANRVMLKIRNFRYTHALNVMGRGDARVLIFPGSPPNFAGMPSLPSLGAPYRLPIFDPLPFEMEDLALPATLEGEKPSVETWVAFLFPEEWEDEILLRPRIAIELRGEVDYEDLFGDLHVTKFSYDMRFSKWGEVTPSGAANINPFSRWFKSGGAEGNKAT